MRNKELIKRVILVVVIFLSLAIYMGYRGLEKVSVKTDTLGEGSVFMYSERPFWGYEINFKNIEGSRCKTIKVNKGHKVDLKFLIETDGKLNVLLEDNEGKVIKDKKYEEVINGKRQLSYKNIEGPYTIKLKFEGEGVGAKIRIKW